MNNIVSEIVKYNQDYFPYEVNDSYGDYSGGEGLVQDIQDMIDNNPTELIDVLNEDIAESNNPDQIKDAKKIIRKLQKITSTTINSASMFGEPEGFFTRDDEIEYIETILYDRFPEIENCRAYIDQDNKGHYVLQVDVETPDFTLQGNDLEVVIDMRKIRKPSDLSKYVNPIANQYLDYVDKWLN